MSGGLPAHGDVYSTYNLSEARQCWKQGGRCFALAVYAIKHQDETTCAFQQAMQVHS